MHCRASATELSINESCRSTAAVVHFSMSSWGFGPGFQFELNAVRELMHAGLVKYS